VYLLTTTMKAQVIVAFRNSVSIFFRNNFFKKTFYRIPVLVAFFMLFLTSESAAYGQEYRYQFRLKTVTDFAEAKMVTDVLRPVFNTEAVPFKVFPTFNDANDQFDFVSEIAVSKEQLEAVLVANGLELTDFTSIQGLESQTEER